jgi:hypothetical protein
MIKKIKLDIDQLLCKEFCEITRIKVIGGWLLNTLITGKKGDPAISSVFISDRDHEWIVLPQVKEEPPVSKKLDPADFKETN